ncbi:hypothetical protein G6F31_016941 [Rhizopus arrhizus]|nr:hypothetical protein G6F31_016941 [Rhizopus arrhizus]
MVHAARDLQQRMPQAVCRGRQPVALDEARGCHRQMEIVQAMHTGQVRLRHEAVADQDVTAGIAAPIQERSRLRAQLHVDPRMLRLEGGQARDQPLHRQRRGRTHAQHAAVGWRLQFGGCDRDACQAGLHFRKIRLRARQQRHAARFAGEQRLAHILFKNADLLADRAVRDAELVGGGREAAQPCRGFEDAQGLQWRQALPRHVSGRPPARRPGA